MVTASFSRFGFTALLAGFLSACSHSIPLDPQIEASSTPPTIDADVGVYFSEDFSTFEHRGSYGGDAWIFPLGPASVKLLGSTFDQVFRKTERVMSLPPFDDHRADLAAVIEPRIEEFDFQIPFLKTSTYTAQIAYRFILHDAKGTPVASWVVNGEGARRGELGFDFSTWPGLAADAAMKDAASKFTAEILNVPEVRRWLRDRGQLLTKVEAPASRKGGD